MHLNKLGVPFHNHSGGQRVPKVIYLCVAAFSVSILITLLNVYELRRVQSKVNGYHGSKEPSLLADRLDSKPIFWAHSKNPDSGHLKHVFAVFERIGFERGDEKSAWDVLWAHDYPFTKLSSVLLKIKSHQMVNHWPGSGWVTNKGNLAKYNLSYIPKAFKMPEDKERLLSYSASNPGRLWIQKSNNHRGINIKNMEDLQLQQSGTFVQEFVQDPYLIDGRKFDIGMYVAMTSINPMRLYLYEADALLRFCSKPYEPFDAKDTKKYVVDDKYTPTWEIPSLKKYFRLNYTFKRSLFAYFKEKGVDADKLWQRMRDVITDAYLTKEPAFIKSAKKYGSTRHFFEMVRFDFLLDSKLNVYLMEVNMSPNLSSGTFPPNKLLYEQVLFSLVNLVGLSSTVHPHHTLKFSGSNDLQNMMVSDRDLQVFEDICTRDVCTFCTSVNCELCSKCLNSDVSYHVRRAFVEHRRKTGFRRILPPSMTQENARKTQPWTDAMYQNMTPANRYMAVWYQGKCLQDMGWCV